MNVLTTSTELQQLVIIPRSNIFDNLYFTDESNNTIDKITIDSFEDKGYYLVLNIFCELIENHFYKIELINNGQLVFRGKVFCTDQEIVNFSVNNGQYTSHSTTNEYITYE
jgi:hypothetical protein